MNLRTLGTRVSAPPERVEHVATHKGGDVLVPPFLHLPRLLYYMGQSTVMQQKYTQAKQRVFNLLPHHLACFQRHDPIY